MTPALIVCVCSVVVLSTIVVIFRIDDARRGMRVMSAVRTRFDRMVSLIAARVHRVHISYGRGVIQLTYHYIVNAVLVHSLQWLSVLEHWVERQMRQNRQTARRIINPKSTRTHLDDLADHKEATSLSLAQKQKLRSLD